MTGEIYNSVLMEHYRGPKKPEMPAAKNILPTLKFLSSMRIFISRAYKTYFALLQGVIAAKNVIKFGLCVEVLRPSQQRHYYYCHKDSKTTDSNDNTSQCKYIFTRI